MSTVRSCADISTFTNSIVRVEGLGLCFYRRFGFRPPKAGEYYLSGAIVEAYRAAYDYTTPYRIVRPTHRAVQTIAYEKGEAL